MQKHKKAIFLLGYFLPDTYFGIKCFIWSPSEQFLNKFNFKNWVFKRTKIYYELTEYFRHTLKGLHFTLIFLKQLKIFSLLVRKVEWSVPWLLVFHFA